MQRVPDKAWAIRTIDNRVVVMDASFQLNEKGELREEVLFFVKGFAEEFLKRYQDTVARSGDKTKFKLVEIDLKPEQLLRAWTADEIHEKAKEELRRCGKN